MAINNDKPTRETLIEVIRATPGITRAEMLAATGLPSGAVDPARIRLWQSGLIAPDSERGWEAALNHRIKDVRWKWIDDPDEQTVVRDRAHTRTERTPSPPLRSWPSRSSRRSRTPSSTSS